MTNYAIIGDGGAGTTAAYHIRHKDPQARITIYSDDPSPAYYRAALTNFLMGELRAEQLFAVPPNFYSDWKVERVLGRVERVDTTGQRLEMADGTKPAFDQLFVASGSRARTLPYPALDGIYPMRTMQDARRCLDEIASGKLKRAIIQGGGILGIEWVAALRNRGVEATFLIREPAFWMGVIDKACSDLVLSRCRSFGVDVRTEEEVAEVLGDGKSFSGVKLKSSGDTIEAQLLGLAVGIIPNIEFLEGSGIKTDRGVVVDDFMRTNVNNVYAGGDCAQVTDPATNKALIMGLWEPARHHGRVAGINMTGGSETWKVQTQYNATRLYDLDLAAIGEVIETPTDEVILDFPTEGARVRYQKLVIREGKLVGALLLGHRKEKPRARGRALHKAVMLGADVSAVRDQLLDPKFDVHNWLGSVSSTGGRTHGVEGSGAPMYATPGTVSASIGRTAPRTGEGSVSTAARSNLATLMRPSGAGERITSLAPTSTAAAPIRPDSLSAAGPGDSGQATLKLPDGRLLPLADQVVLGRGQSSHLILKDDQVAERHAVIERKGNVYVISPAADGTWVNGEPASQPRILKHGDVIRLGRTSFDFSQQMLPPRPETGPVGLPAEPLDPAPTHADSSVYGRIETQGRMYDVSKQETDIGQDPTSEVPIADTSASYHHAQISRLGTDLYLRDLGSKQGTFVNGAAVNLPHKLQEGDVIRIGSTDLVFHAVQLGTGPQPSAVPLDAGIPTQTQLPGPQAPQVAPSGGPETKPSGAAQVAPSGAPQTSTAVPTGGPSADPSYFRPVPAEDIATQPAQAAPAATPSTPGAPAPKPVARTPARLNGIEGPMKGISIALPGAALVIGRSKECQLRIDDPNLNEKHAVVESLGGEWVVQDLGTTNGTYVNGHRLAPNLRTIIASGDHIRVGGTIFELEVGLT